MASGWKGGAASGGLLDSGGSVEKAKSALAGLLQKHEAEKKLSQVELAKKLKPEIQDLRARGISFAEISNQLRAVAGINISKAALGEAVKKRSRKPKSSAGKETVTESAA